MRNDLQSNQRYETGPINNWIRAFVCLKLFSIWDTKNEEVRQRHLFSSITEKRKRTLTSHCFFSFFLSFSIRCEINSQTYPVVCSSDFSDKCHSHFFLSISKRTDVLPGIEPVPSASSASSVSYVLSSTLKRKAWEEFTLWDTERRKNFISLSSFLPIVTFLYKFRQRSLTIGGEGWRAGIISKARV